LQQEGAEYMAEQVIPLEREQRRPVRTYETIEFAVIHLIPLLALITGATAFDWLMCGVLYFTRMFFVTGFYHRYFSHKTFKTSRVFQFIMAFLAETSLQKGILWWAAHHRVHHRTSDTPQDPHSMKIYGFFYSHMGWILGPDYKRTDFKGISDYAKYPELRWINKNYLIPPLTLALALMAVGGVVNGGSITMMFTSAGVSTLLIGFFLSTVLLYHGTFSINSIMHKLGRQRYETGDESRNSALLAMLTLGEGWHNNHHYYESSTRQGFFWWEVDITFYLLKVLSWFGIIWDLKEVPKYIKYSRNKKEAHKLKKEYETLKKSA
jgi:stearoyl-CoA desaturase (delta-9 desaturase)